MALSEEDRLLAQSMTNFAQGLRRGNEQEQGFDQRDKELSFGANIQKQQSEQRFGQRKEILGQQQEFSAEQSALDRASREGIAERRGAETTNINIANQFREQVSNVETTDLAEAGIVEQDPDTGAIIVNPDNLVKASSQAHFLRSKAIRLEKMTEKRFDSIRDDTNSRAELMRQELAKAGHDTFIADFLVIKPKESKARYVERLKGLRNRLISREIKSRMRIASNEGFDPTASGQGGGFAELARRPKPTAANLRERRKDIILEVEEEFGGK